MRVSTLSCLAVAVLAVTLVGQVFADSSWSGGRPTTGLVYDDAGSHVTLSNSYDGLDVGGIHDAQSSIAVQVSQYSPSYTSAGGVTYDMYTIRVMGAATSRLPHKYIVDGYGANYYDCSSLPLYSNPCAASGITTPNTGAWFNLPGNFYYGGTAFNRIFVCANGWVAFVVPDSYTNNCGPGSANALPGIDYVDSSSIVHDVPQGVIAPLWKPLDPSPASGSAGQISIAFLNTSPPFECGNDNPCAFFVIWNQVATTGSNTSCGGGPCRNTFSLAIWSPSCNLYCPPSIPSNYRNAGIIQIGYRSIDPSDSQKGIVGVDDASGTLVKMADRDTAVCGVSPCPSNGNQGADHGVMLEDFWWGNYLLSDSKFILTKGSGDSLTNAAFLTDYPYLYGFNTQPNGAAPQPADLAPGIAAVGESVGLYVLCTALTDGVCFAVGTGTAVLEAYCHCLESLVRQFLYQPNTSPVYKVTPMGSTQTATMEMPVSQNGLCGIAGYHYCAADTALWDTIQWTVPHDSGTHTLQISYQIQAGSQIGGNSASVWETTSVNLSVGPEGDFGVTPNCSAVALQVGGYQTNCSVILSAGNGFYGKISLLPSAPVNGGPQATITNTPSTGVFQLAQNTQATANLSIQSGNAPGSYYVTVTATSGIRVHTISILVNVYGVDGTTQAFCGHSTNSCPASLTTTRGNDVIIVYAMESLDLQSSCTFGVSDTAGLTWNARSGIVYGRSNRDQLQEFWAQSPGILSSDTITESISGCAGIYGGEYNGFMALAISGAVLNDPFDHNAALPGKNSGNSVVTSASVSTNVGGEMIISGMQHGGNGPVSPQAGFTLISMAGSGEEYGFTNTVLTNSAVTFTGGTSDYWEQISDVIRGNPGTISMAVSPTSVSWACNPYGCDNPSPQSIVLTIASANGFDGTVQLSYVAPNPSGGSSLTGPSSVYVPSGGSAHVTLYAYKASQSGDYVWTIRGGSLASTTVTLSYRYCSCF